MKSARPNAKSIDTAKELLNYLEIPDGANTLKLNLAGNHQKLSVLTQTMVNSCRTLHQYLGEMSTRNTTGGTVNVQKKPFDPFKRNVYVPKPILNPILNPKPNLLTDLQNNTAQTNLGYNVNPSSESPLKFFKFYQSIITTGVYNEYESAIIEYIFNQDYVTEDLELVERLTDIFGDFKESLNLTPDFEMAKNLETGQIYRINNDGSIYLLDNKISSQVLDKKEIENIQLMSVSELADYFIKKDKMDRSIVFVKSLIKCFELSNLYSQELVTQQTFYDTNDILNTGSLDIDGSEIRLSSDEFKQTDSYKLEKYYLENNVKFNNLAFNFSQQISNILDLLYEYLGMMF